MTQPEPSIPTLDYARILYQGEQRLRSATGAVFAVLSAGVAVGCYLAFRSVAVPYCYVCLACAFLWGAASAYLWWMIFVDGVHRFEIRTDGIVAGGTLTHWSNIMQFGVHGHASAKRVSMYFLPRPIGPVVHLSTTPPTTPREYEQLVELLEDEILPLYPRLKLGGYQFET
jgi:hypothetical protein